MAKQTTILLVANSTWNLVHYRRPWIEAMLRAGYKVLTAAPIDKYISALEQLTGQIHYPLYKLVAKGTNIVADWACFRELRGLYITHQPDMAVHFTIKPNIYGGLAARLTKTPYIGVITGFGYAFLRGGWHHRLAIWLHQMGLTHARKVVFYNASDLAAFEQMGAVTIQQGIIIHGSGVDVEAFAQLPLPPLERKSLRFLYLGRMLRDKGILELVQATRKLLDEGANIQLRLVGSTDALNPAVLSKKVLQTYAGAMWKDCSQEEAEETGIQYFPPTGDVRSHLQWCHVFVLPSYREGLSKAGVEALASGRPVLLSDVPGCRELVGEAPSNGVLVPPRSISALAEGMMSFIDKEPAQWQVMAQRSRHLAEKKFAAAHSSAAFLQLLKATLK